MKIRKNIPISKKEKRKPRKTWDFIKMKVGDCVDVTDKTEWPQAAKYAHTFGAQKKWVFRTTWLEDEKLGRIRRIK